jgi:hypothetical protein
LGSAAQSLQGACKSWGVDFLVKRVQSKGLPQKVWGIDEGIPVMNITTEKITVHIPGHGYYSFTPAEFDLEMTRQLPASANQLRIRLGERTGIDYSDVYTVTELLAVFADIESYGL